jgi:hypothetical protein
MSGAKGLVLVTRFLLELCALAAVAYWGSRLSSSTVVNVIAAILAPLIVATVWGVWLAPTAGRRLQPPARTFLELAVLGVAVAALLAVGATVLAVILAVAAILDGVLLHIWDLDRQVHGSRSG